MDPVATLIALLENIRDKDFDSASIELEDLTDWCKKEGYIPTDELNRAIVALKGSA